MPFKYQSGEEVRQGDLVLFHGEPGHIEFIADPGEPTKDTEWYVQEYGGGVMVIEPKHFGRAFLTDTENAEDLVLSRDQKTPYRRPVFEMIHPVGFGQRPKTNDERRVFFGPHSSQISLCGRST